ncbi:MAG: tetratricopeptide repeat protein [Desulfobacterales bacterium]|nr:tetratricopeptide repeat protein [Desulfobacterales bacterium]
MAKKRNETPKSNRNGRFTGETLGIVAFVCIAVGFLLGVAFTIYRTDAGAPMPAGMPPRADNNGSQSPDMTARIAQLTEEAARHPDNPKLWVELGHHYFDTNNAAKAIEAYRKALDLEPDSADVWTDMGVMYRRSGNPKEAVAAFDRAMAIAPNHEVSRFNKGIVLLHDLNDSQGAIKAWEDLLRINPLAMGPNGQSIDELIGHFRSQMASGKEKK